MELVNVWWEVTQAWLIGLAAGTVLSLICGGWIFFESDGRKYFARGLLTVVTLAIAAPFWPIAAPAISLLILKWAWSNSDIDVTKPLPRAERRRIQRELDTARADKILDEALRESRLR